MRRKGNVNKEKIISAVIACGVVFALGIGVVSVVSSTKKMENQNNIVDLNEGTGNNVAMENNNNNNTDKDKNDKTYNGDANYYNNDEIKQIYDSHKETEKAKEEASGGADQNPSKAQGNDTVGVAADAKKDPASGYTFSAESTLQWPVKGEIVLKYSMDSTILFKSLGVYKCNPAVSIAAKAGDNVGVAADGVVTDVHVSEETGTTVSIAIGGGYITTYGLLDGVVVKKGDKVVAGQLLGTVAEPTAYYVEEGSNVYFKLTKDDEPVDPMDFLAE